MRFPSILIALGLAVGARAFAAPAAPSAEELLKDSDRARGAIKDGVAWDIDVHTYSEDGENQVHYAVKVKGDDALSEATAPPRNRGDMMIFNDRNIWFFKPGTKKPVAISPRQKLMGEAAYGDVASTQYYRDYDGKIVGEEKVNGKDCWKLDLKAKAKNVTYDGIRYWISKAEHLGVKSEFLTVSGEMFKSAVMEYHNKMTLDGKTFPFVSKMDITDALKPSSHTALIYSAPKAVKLADSIFNVNNLVR